MILIDTHVLVWTVTDSRRLGPEARAVLQRDPHIGVSAITPWEIANLVRKGRLEVAIDVADWLTEALTQPRIVLLPLDPRTSVESTRLQGYPSGDPADRILIATARHWDVPLMTADQVILAYGAEGEVQVIDAGK